MRLKEVVMELLRHGDSEGLDRLLAVNGEGVDGR
jgi:hypothetical protein